MKAYVRFIVETGEITGTGYADPENFGQVAQEGEAVIAGSGTPEAHYVDLDTLTIEPKRPNPARPDLTAGKVDCARQLVDIAPGSRVRMLTPTGAALEIEVRDGKAYFAPALTGRHTWLVESAQTFPVRWILDVIA